LERATGVRTGDVQLGNFLLKMMFSIFAATTYLFRSKNLFSDLSNFNWFQAFYFWLGHVLGMCLPTRPTLKLWQLSKIELGQVVGLQDQR